LESKKLTIASLANFIVAEAFEPQLCKAKKLTSGNEYSGHNSSISTLLISNSFGTIPTPKSDRFC